MKKVFYTLLLVLSFYNSNAQMLKIYSTAGAIFNGVTKEYQGFPIMRPKPNHFLLAYQENYITLGAPSQELIQKNNGMFTFELKPVQQVNISNSRYIKISGVVNKTTEFGPKTMVYNGVAYSKPGVNFNYEGFISAIGADMAKAGYAISNLNSSGVFVEKEKTADYALAGEITYAESGSLGTPGFKVALLIDWSLYDVAQGKVIYKVTTAGYSNSKREHTLTDELILAIQNSLLGLIPDNELIKIVTSKGSNRTTGFTNNGPTKFPTDVTIIPAVTAPSYPTYGSMVQASVKSVVSIKTDFGHGSGFIISNDGYIITNSHVVSGSENLEVIFNNGISLPATVVAENTIRDMALLKVAGKGYTPLPLSLTNENNEIGTEVIAIGTPENLKLGQTVTKGIISGNRSFDDMDFIQTDVSINAGNSGGALLNYKGEVIGVVVAKIKGSGVEGLGFAIPITQGLNSLLLRVK